ncbi:MAG: hypothetical protein ACI89U_001616, partial [Gammaproteobacteria bacterium]
GYSGPKPSNHRNGRYCGPFETLAAPKEVSVDILYSYKEVVF